MLVQNSVYRNIYLTDGVNKDFYFSFPILEASQVLVQTSLLTNTDVVTDVVTTVDPSQYTVTGVGQTTGGHISFTTAPPTGSRIALTLNIPITQLYQYAELDSFPAKSHEDALAKLTLICQQLKEQLERAVRLPPTSNESPEDVVASIYASRDEAQTASGAAQAAKAEAGQSAAQAAASAAGASAAVAAATATAVTTATAQADRAQSAANAAQAAAGAAADEARQAVATELNRASSEADRAQSEADRAKMEANRAQSLANIGPATVATLGMVKIGNGIAVEEDGTISVPPPPEINLATNTTAGTVIVGAGLDITGLVEEGQDSPAPGTLSLAAHSDESGEKYGRGDGQFFGHVKLTDDFEQDADATSGISISPKGVKTAFNRVVGILDEQVITTSRDWIVPETGRYQITTVGGGGSGGSGGVADSTSFTYDGDPKYIAASGGGGGGGGSGETTTITATLTKGKSYTLTVGGAGGTTSFGSVLTARGGGKGGNGSAGTVKGGDNYSMTAGTGGAGGTSYGGASGKGGGGKTQETNGYGFTATGGSGGSGGVSVEGYYGNGGAGGVGGGRVSSGNTINTTNPGGGSVGRQGCIKIKILPA